MIFITNVTSLEYYDGALYYTDSTSYAFTRLTLNKYVQSPMAQIVLYTQSINLLPAVPTLTSNIGGICYDTNTGQLIIYGFTNGVNNFIYFVDPSNGTIYQTIGSGSNSTQEITQGYYNIFYTNIGSQVATLNLNSGVSTLTATPNLANIPTDFSRFICTATAL